MKSYELTRTNGRYFIDGKRVSKERFREMEEKAYRSDCFWTRCDGDKVTQGKFVYIN